MPGGSAATSQREMDDPASAISASYALGQAYWYRGDLQLAEEALLPSATRVSSGLELKSAGTTGSAAVLCVGCLANTYSFQGQFEKAFSSSTAALAIAMKTNRPYDLSYAHIARGLAFLMKGEIEPAIEDLEEALRVCRAGEIHLLVPAAARYLARAYALAERAREAREIIEEALGLANTQTLASLQAWCGSSLALAHLAAGAWREAEAAAAAALEHAQRHGYHPVEALALRSLALSFARRNSERARACRASVPGSAVGRRQDRDAPRSRPLPRRPCRDHAAFRPYYRCTTGAGGSDPALS